MNTKKLLTSLLISLSLTACSSTETMTKTVAPLPASEACCNDFSQFPWIQLNSTENLDFQLDSSSPIGHFSDGNSYFNAFKLPQRSKKVILGVSSLMINDSVVAPKVITLDENFNLVSTTSLDQFDVKTSGAFTRTQFEINFEVDASKTPYVIIYSSSDYLGQSIKVKHPARVRSEEFGEPMPMVTDPTYQYERFGQLVLSVKTLSLQAYKAPVKEVQSAPKAVQQVAKPVLPETRAFYQNAITEAVNIDDISKALSLLEEAKKLGIEGAQTIFIEALENRAI